jgi:hypothetical protein
MKDTSKDSKSFPSKKTVNFPWRDKRLKKKFHWTEFNNPKLKKITLENQKENVSYVMELIDEPTKWFLQGEQVKASTWYRYSISNQDEFYEWGLVRIVREINNLLRLGCTIKEIIQ